MNLSALVGILKCEVDGICEVVAASHFSRGTEAIEDTACTTMIESHMRGHALSAIPRLQEIRDKIVGKKACGGYSAHYFEDVELALQLDRFNFAAEIKVVDDKVMEVVRVNLRN